MTNLLKYYQIHFKKYELYLFLSILQLFLAVTSITAQETNSTFVKLEQYKPIYFIFGRPDTKVQLSFKVKLIQGVDLYFAYTQLMLWDLIKPSAPLRDINYNPDFFYRLENSKNIGNWLDIGYFEHESNGRDGRASRAWNRAYLLLNLTPHASDQIVIRTSIKIWYAYGIEEMNRDYLNYRGRFEIQFTLTHPISPFIGVNQAILRLYPGGSSKMNLLKGGQELTLRNNSTYLKIIPNSVVQVFHGFGENMLDYKEERLGLRAGIGF